MKTRVCSAFGTLRLPMPMAQRSDSLLRDIHDARFPGQLALTVTIAACLGEARFWVGSNDRPPQAPTRMLGKRLGYLGDDPFSEKSNRRTFEFTRPRDSDQLEPIKLHGKHAPAARVQRFVGH